MRIVLVSLNFAPELTGIGKYSGEMASGLVARGHEVTVLCAPPYYPSWQVQPGYAAGSYRSEQPEPGLTVHRCPTWIPQRPTGLARLLHLASFAASSFLMLLRLLSWRPQVIFLVAPALVCAPGVLLCARLVGAQTWLHVQDFEVDAAFSLGLLKAPLLQRAARGIERFLMRRFAVVSTISRRMMTMLATKGVAPQRVALLPNAANLTGVQAGPRSEALRARLGIPPSHLVCLYAGSLNRKQGLGVLIEAMQRLPEGREISLVICGDGELRGELEAAARGQPDVHFLNLCPAEELNELLNLADIHLLPQLCAAADLVLPSKLVGMLASGRPVVAAASLGTEIASIVVTCGLTVEPENAEAFAQAIEVLAADPALRQTLGRAGRLHAEQMLDMEVVFNDLNHRLLQLGRGGPAAAVAAEAPQGPSADSVAVGAATQSPR